MEAAWVGLRIAPAVLTVIFLGGLTACLLLRRRTGRVREAMAGTFVAAAAFLVQSGSVGPSAGGAVLALATGALTALLMALFSSV